MLPIKKLHPKAVIPTRGSPKSGGLDLYARLEEKLVILPGEIKKVSTGIALELPEGTVGLLYGRSSLGVQYGVVPANGVGVIDADYRGEIIVGLINHGKEAYRVEQGDRIAQLVVTPVLFSQPVEVEELSDTQRSQGGFGSTGR